MSRPRHEGRLGLNSGSSWHHDGSRFRRFLRGHIRYYDLGISGQLERASVHDFVFKVVNVAIAEQDKSPHLVLPILIQLFEFSRPYDNLRGIHGVSQVNP